MANLRGSVYLICFKSKLHHAKHYVGFAEEGNLEKRIETHRRGNGSKLMKAVNQNGIEWEVARVWENKTRGFERRIKNQNNTKRYCPFCSDEPKNMGV